jgi:hypothetical protein
MQTILKITISAVLLMYLIQKVSFHTIASTLGAAHLTYYIFSIVLYIIAQPLRTLRWGLLLRIKNIHFSQLKLSGLYFIGMFFNNFLPTVMGGDVVRGYYVFRESRSHEAAFSSVIVERLCGLFVIVIIGFIASIYVYINSGFIPILTVSGSGCFMMLLLMIGFLYEPVFSVLSVPLRMFRKWGIGEKVNEVYQAILSYKNCHGVLLQCVLLSALYELVIIFIHYVLSIALNWGIPFHAFLCTVPVITIISMLPVSFGGLGVREGAAVLLFSHYGISAASAISLSLLSYSISLIAGAIGGILYPIYKTEPIKTDEFDG